MEYKNVIAIDAMGGDNAPAEIIKGAIEAINERADIKLRLFGDKDKIETELNKYTYNKEQIGITHTTEEISCNEAPAMAIKKKKDSSLVVAIKSVKSGECDAIVSAGSSGAILVGGQVLIGKGKGVKRAPLAPLTPTAKGVSLLIDCGANVDARPEHLLQFAQMGSIYMEDVVGVKNPRVAIVNIGAEEAKGNALVKETYPLLKACKNINFIGSIEARDIPKGEVGYVITGAKDVSQSKVGDTITSALKPAADPLEGYRDPQPMVYAGLFPIDNAQYPELREALDKLKLNDAALIYEPETSVALGFGFRCGFLGLLHMEIVTERLSREFDLDLISTAPNVPYEVTAEDNSVHRVTNPSEFPDGKIKQIVEPVVAADIITPKEFIGAVMDLCQDHRGQMGTMEYISADRVEMHYRIPLAEIVFDFFDQLKSRTKGYASLDYHEDGEQSADLVKVDILIQGEKVDAFSAIVHKDKAYSYGVMMTKKLRELIPRQQFEIPIQAAIGSRIIARENIRALRKDVLAKCYGGDISRKRKLLEKQKAGKKRMKMLGHVEVPQEAFIAALSTGDAGNDRDTKDKIRAAQKTEG